MFQNAELEGEHVDERSVDDLLSFINGNGEGNLNIFYPCFLWNFSSLLPGVFFKGQYGFLHSKEIAG